MEGLTPQQRDMLKAGAILVVLMAGGLGYYGYQFVRPAIEANKKKLETVEAKIKDVDRQIRELDSAFANIDELRRKQEYMLKIRAKLPNTIDAPGFYQALIKILEITAVEYSNLKQLEPQVRPVYTEIPYSIICRSRYHSFGQFLNLIEENPDRFMRVKTFKVENDSERPSIHPVDVQLATFMFNTKG